MWKIWLYNCYQSHVDFIRNGIVIRYYTAGVHNIQPAEAMSVAHVTCHSTSKQELSYRKQIARQLHKH